MQQRPKSPGPASPPLLFAPPQGPDALPKTLPPPALSAIRAAFSPQNDNDVDEETGNDAARLGGRTSSGWFAARTPPTEERPPEPPASRQLMEAPPTLRGRIDWLDAEAVLDELGEDQLALTMRIAAVQRAAQAAAKDDATKDAADVARERLRDLADVSEALAELQRAAIPRRVHRAFLPDAPLADYARGVYAWTHAVVRALEELVLGIRRGERKTKPMDLSAADEPNEPDWAAYRWRIEEAKNFHFHELERAIRADLATLVEDLDDEDRDDGSNPADQLVAAFDVLLAKARALEATLDLD